MGLRKSETAESATVPPAFANWPLGRARERLKDQQRVQALEFPTMATVKAAVLDSHSWWNGGRGVCEEGSWGTQNGRCGT